MNYFVVTYLVYLSLSIALVVWVARTLLRYGLAFLPEVIRENAALTEAVNHLLVVGFYLINLGCVSIFLRSDEPILQPQGIFEVLSAKMGLVLLVLGTVHFFIVGILTVVRQHVLHGSPPPVPPPIPPDRSWLREARVPDRERPPGTSVY